MSTRARLSYSFILAKFVGYRKKKNRNKKIITNPIFIFIAVVLYSILRYRFFLIQTIRYLQFIAYKEGLILLIYSSVLFVCINIIQYSFPTKELKEKSRYDE